MRRAIEELLLGHIRLRMIPVLADNFIYLLDDGKKAVLIDASEAAPVVKMVRAESLVLLQVLITHDHADHTAGCRRLQDELGVLARSPSVIERTETWLGTSCEVLATPGHTAVHKSFYFPELDVVFTGDALINGGCGRVMVDGSAAMLYASLQQIATLPEQTRLFGGHDYLLDNLDFAQTEGVAEAPIEERRRRYATDPAEALFMTLAEERKTNPFLRCDSAEVFAQVRARKDRF
jgi:hydroxyacylglutathione hydrolase